MRRLAVSTLALFVALGAGSLVFGLVAPDDDLDIGDEVVQVISTNQDEDRETVWVSPARADRWVGGEAPTRREADQRYGVGNDDLAPIVRRYDARAAEALGEEDSTRDAADGDCRYWPVVEAGGSAEDLEGVVRLCYGSDRPGSRPKDVAYRGVDPG
ncbi:hypothetical protein [Nocardioides aurantiacus]|uniref:Uncharacterized protein n=1 Tax=Nocardioides aurantiacus TaxID=86796 RepID=A0A3N2CUT3_9ACTN|nr:hypothetical protein [Nocardioides aurantiacus]ROR91297.1 hypothetical protein EDD33_2163 [Nocardioides aurantiacus]